MEISCRNSFFKGSSSIVQTSTPFHQESGGDDGKWFAAEAAKPFLLPAPIVWVETWRNGLTCGRESVFHSSDRYVLSDKSCYLTRSCVFVWKGVESLDEDREEEREEVLCCELNRMEKWEMRGHFPGWKGVRSWESKESNSDWTLIPDYLSLSLRWCGEQLEGTAVVWKCENECHENRTALSGHTMCGESDDEWRVANDSSWCWWVLKGFSGPAITKYEERREWAIPFSLRQKMVTASAHSVSVNVSRLTSKRMFNNTMESTEMLWTSVTRKENSGCKR